MPLMTAALAPSLIDALLGSKLSGDRVSLEGLTMAVAAHGALEFGLRRLEMASLRVASGPLVLEVGKLAFDQLVALVRIDGGGVRLSKLEAAGAELSGVKVRGPLDFAPAAGPWTLGPLAGADGTVRAEIVDAHLLFDADVTVPIRRGRIGFEDATVEHVGPDSRMGVSRLGLYVDAPNGRSYLYQFSSPPVAGVEYERRGAMPGPWAVTDRGSLQLQPFAEWLLRQPLGGQAHGLTEQARLLFGRTAVSGQVQLGDGPFAAPFAQADLVGRSGGRNVVRLHSQAVGRGLTAEIASLSARNAASVLGGTRLECDELAGALTLQLSVEGGQLHFQMDLPSLKASGLRMHVRIRPDRPVGP